MHRKLSLLLPLAIASTLAAQSSNTLTGTLRDPQQSIVPDATIQLDGPGLHLTTRTDSNGLYRFNAPTGSYTLTAQRPGFESLRVSISLTADTTQDIAFTTVASSSSVDVIASNSGTAADGYYVARVDRGVLGNAPVVDQPYVITTVSADKIANVQARSFRDTMKYLPLVSFTEQQGPEILRPATRGLQGSIAQNTRMDGMAMAITGANAMEQYQALQVEQGLGAAMYGPANPSGLFDFVLKRPTEDRATNVYLEQDSSSVGTAWIDTGGRIGPHKILGYRSNLLFGDGTQFVEGSRLRRRLAMFAFDVRPTNRTTIDAHYSVYDIVQRGYPGWFSYGPSSKTNAAAPDFILPAAPDPTRPGYGQVYAGVNLTTQSTSARLLHDFSPNWHLMAGGLGQRLDRFIDTPVNTITDNNGNYSSSLGSGFAPRFGVLSDLGYLTGLVKKWGITHDVVVASQGYKFSQYGYTTNAPANLALGTANVNNPIAFAPPKVGLPKNLGIFASSIVHQQGFNLGDLLTFKNRFMVRVAASQDWIGVDNYTATARTGGSNKQGISPSASVLYKPTGWSTVYATYASSLQQGDIAPVSASLVNSGASLAPYRSKEWELGFKTSNQMQGQPIALTAALFRLQRPFAETIAYNGSATQTVFAIVGQQVNYGAELSAQGTLFHRLTIDGGFTALNARLNDTGIASTNGKRFVGIPSYKSNVLAEYRIPKIANLSITGDWQFLGRRVQDDQNLHYSPGFSTYDFGFRYSHALFTKLATLRFSTNNITNTRYYSTIAAGDITGSNASANVAHLGTPRTISTSLQFDF